MKRSARFGLFLGSYSPLFILLSILHWKNNLLGSFKYGWLELPYLSFLFIALAFIGIVIVLSFLKIAKKLSPVTIRPTVLDRNMQDTLAYLITYLIPFVGFTFDDYNALIANIFIFGMIGFLYIQSNMIYLNPVLSILGYKVLKLVVKDNEVLMLAKNNLKNDNGIKVTILSEGLYIESDK
ncbi:MAG TPA: hypothetical protein VD907_00840 [Verrucomicrobiae bacterium]|nr:hypothetical protein [Verrucomicrobiae bacterium]